MNLYIFRHGQTAFSGKTPGEDRNYGDQTKTAEILPQAIPPLERLGKHLKNIETDFNISSTFLRCRQTVEIVSKFSEKVFELDDKLRDIDHRIEIVEEVAKRIDEFYKNLESKDYKSVAICTHGYPIAMLISRHLDGKVDLSKIENYPTTGVLVSIIDGKVSYKDFN